MRLMLVTILLVAAASLVAVPASARDDPRVVVVGQGQLAGGAKVSVLAVSGPGHGVIGRLFVESAPGFQFLSTVTCVREVGDRVLVGGTIIRATNPATIGHTSLVAVADGGNDDLVGIAFSSSGLDTCPVFDLPMIEVASGNFVVV